MENRSDQLKSFDESTRRESELMSSVAKRSAETLENWTGELLRQQKAVLASTSECMESDLKAFEERMRTWHGSVLRAFFRMTILYSLGATVLLAGVMTFFAWRAGVNLTEYREAKAQRESLGKVIERDATGAEWIRVDVSRYSGTNEFFQGDRTGNQYGKLLRGKDGHWYAPLGR